MSNKVRVKSFFLVVFLFIALIPCLNLEASVSPDEATLIGTNFIAHIIGTDGGWGEATGAYVIDCKELKRGELLLGYHLSIYPRGYIVVSLLKQLPPVKSFSTTCDFDTESEEGYSRLLKDTMEATLLFLQEEYGTLEEEELPDGISPQANRDAWESLLGSEASPVESVTVGPLLQTTWGQGAPYNNDCPLGYNNRRTVIGCVATAAAQIMKYWNWPPSGIGSHSYGWDGDDSCGTAPVGGGTLNAAFSDPYDWANMLNSYAGAYTSTQAAAVAELCHEVGVAFDMDYGVCGSGTGSYPWVYSNYFRYKNTITEEGRYYYATADDWFKKIRAELDASPLRPIHYTFLGLTGTEVTFAHATVCDGYKIEGGRNYIHINYGWEGSNDNWYALDNLYTRGSTYQPTWDVMLCGIEPAPDLTLSSSDISFNPELPVEGYQVTITAGIHNMGGTDTHDVKVQFFDGDPDYGGIQIGEDQVINVIPPAEQLYTIRDTKEYKLGWLQSFSGEIWTWRQRYDPHYTTKILFNAGIDEYHWDGGASIYFYYWDINGNRILLAQGDKYWKPEDREYTINTYTTGVEIQIFVGGWGNSTYSEAWCKAIFNFVRINYGSAAAQVTWDTTGEAGQHDIYVKVDPKNTIAEFNENNNKASKAITVSVAEVRNIDTGQTYHSIQNAIDDPATLDGHTIQVRAGTFRENVVINKSLTIEGENCNSTIIECTPGVEGSWRTVTINADNVTLARLKIESGKNCHGIVIDSANYSKVKDCKITSNVIGVVFKNASSDNTITDSEIFDNTSHGIYLGDIAVGRCCQYSNTIEKNEIYSNGGDGICGYKGTDRTRVINNTIHHNMGVSSSGINFALSTWTIKNNYVGWNTEYGIGIDSASNNVIEQNEIEHNNDGIGIYYTGGPSASSKNLIEHNTVRYNAEHGIVLLSGATNNTIRYNSIEGNGQHVTNGTGLRIENDSNNPNYGNLIHHNNLIENGLQAYDLSLRNNDWDNNHWSNWTQPDANNDGYVDIPYRIYPYYKLDNYPFVFKIGHLYGSAYYFPDPAFPYKASFSMDITHSFTPSGWLKYYYSRTRMNFVSTAITHVRVPVYYGAKAEISGTGKVNGVDGYTFTATLFDGSQTRRFKKEPLPDKFKITINRPDGTIYYSDSAGPYDIVGGDLIVWPSIPLEKRVFVTSQTYNGNLGGLSGADAKCQTLADAAGLFGDYKAWLSDTQQSPSTSTQFSKSTVPYVLVDGTRIADDWTDLTAGSLQQPIDVNELGDNIGQSFVWTATEPNGLSTIPNEYCLNWTWGYGAYGGGIGLSDQTDVSWTKLGNLQCHGGPNQARLYCFEQ